MIPLNQSEPLKKFVEECVKIGWCFGVQKPEVELEFGERTFSEDRHVRFQGVNFGSNRIQSYLWPGLLDSSNGSCLHKAVVVTM